ncbi:TPA: ribosome-associated translation inhibitor RaiA [Candidatus Poribacteria bacterium]|nr:ribosome-associated translation inhibitor RaiA [Candidatus Poribacteria bacterium]HEX30626.1 ribosome-associated translation inhibitor RaiA [Candidatus Poribacteria bacterium]
MEIYINTRNLDLTDDIYRYVHKKLSKAEHFYGGITEAHVIIETVKYHTYTVEVSLLGRHVAFHAQADGETVFSAIDGVVDKIERQVRRYKERIKGRKHKLPQREVVMELSQKGRIEEGMEDEEEEDVVRVTDKFAPKPMSLDEAIMQFKLSDDDLIVFVNSQTNSVNVLFRMKNGKIGWIEPVFD